MARVTRPGGVVVVSEVDAGTIFLNASDRALTAELIRDSQLTYPPQTRAGDSRAC